MHIKTLLMACETTINCAETISKQKDASENQYTKHECTLKESHAVMVTIKKNSARHYSLSHKITTDGLRSYHVKKQENRNKISITCSSSFSKMSSKNIKQ